MTAGQEEREAPALVPSPVPKGEATEIPVQTVGTENGLTVCPRDAGAAGPGCWSRWVVHLLACCHINLCPAMRICNLLMASESFAKIYICKHNGWNIKVSVPGGSPEYQSLCKRLI